MSRRDIGRLFESTGCEVRHDDLTRQLYSTDASIYQVVPKAVAFPRSAAQAAAATAAADGAGLAVTPRGAASGLTGGALGEGLVLDMARHRRRILELDAERRIAWVEPGVVLDQLNDAARPHGLWFGPDVATSTRATLGGMIGNCSSGARAPVYGTTADHIEALEVVLADGRRAVVGPEAEGLAEIAERAQRLIDQHAETIASRLPRVLVKHWPGYGLDRALGAPGDLAQLVCGSEGTLAIVCSAALRLVPLPAERGLGVLFFDSVIEAMEAAVELLELEPAAVEHIDRMVFESTRSLAAFAEARSFLQLDSAPCESMLLVEVFDDVADKLDRLSRSGLGRRRLICADSAEQELAWFVRKAGLNLVASSPGPAKTVAGIEDVCVRPQHLPDYVRGVREILEPRGIDTSFYGHAASGLLHVRPTVDLHTAEGVATLREIADEISDLCLRFGGSLAAEHGVGIGRTEYIEAHLGPELVELTTGIKQLFDPGGVLNPGKIIDTGRFKIDQDLRYGPGYQIKLPFEPLLGFVDRDGSFVGNLEQCNGCGGCRKDAASMCPTYQAVADEIMSTRGRANVVRAALDGRLGSAETPFPEELLEALGSCLSCKACKRECPSGVDMALLKAELLHARHQSQGAPLRDRVIAAADVAGRIGSATAPLANAFLRLAPGRSAVARILGLDAKRRLPPFASDRFDRWMAAHSGPREPAAESGHSSRPAVLLWDDTWVRYHEPGIGRAAVRVLEAAGLEVRAVPDRQCCGRPAFSRGLLDKARRHGEHNLALLVGRTEPIVFLEPSCYSMFVDEYRQLGLPGADEVAARCRLLEDMLLERLDEAPEALPAVGRGQVAAVHAHCHVKALAEPASTARLLLRLGFSEASVLPVGCCGMAGAFGLERSRSGLSRQVGGPLIELVDSLGRETVVVASGTSCRHQIGELSRRRAAHLAEVLVEALAIGETSKRS